MRIKRPRPLFTTVSNVSELEFMEFLTLLLAFETSGLRLPRLLVEIAEGRVEASGYIKELANKFKVLEKTMMEDYSALRKLAELAGSPMVADFLRGYSEVATTSGETLRFVESYLERVSSYLESRLEGMLRFMEGVYEGLMLAVFGLVALSVVPMAGVNPRMLTSAIILAALASYSIVLKVSENVLTLSRVEHIATITLMGLTLVTELGGTWTLLHMLLLALALVLVAPLARRAVEIEKNVVDFLEEAFSMTRHGIPLEQVFHHVEFGSDPLKLLKRVLLLGYDYVQLLGALPDLARRALYQLLAPLQYTSKHEKISSYVLRFVELISDARARLERRGLTYMVYSFIFPAVVYVSYALVHSMSKTIGGAIDFGQAKVIAYSTFFNTFTLAVSISGIGLFRSRKIGLLLFGSLLAIVLLPSP